MNLYTGCIGVAAKSSLKSMLKMYAKSATIHKCIDSLVTYNISIESFFFFVLVCSMPFFSFFLLVDVWFSFPCFVWSFGDVTHLFNFVFIAFLLHNHNPFLSSNLTLVFTAIVSFSLFLARMHLLRLHRHRKCLVAVCTELIYEIYK